MTLEKTIKMHDLINIIISVLDARDPYTFEHSWRVAALSENIASKMDLDKKWVDIIHIAAHLHDLGKIGITDSVLNKKGRLSSPEFELMKTHPVIGYNIVRNIPELNEISSYVLHHHERWDGSGYPDGISGRDIPLGARIISIADSFDAMTTKRSYRDEVSIEEGLLEIERCSGTQFCPETTAVFLRMRNDIYDILESVRNDIFHTAFIKEEQFIPLRGNLTAID